MIRIEAVPADILSRIPDARELLEGEERILFAYLFGGLASDRVTPLSDVDIAVYVLTGSDFNEYKLELFDRLTQVLGTAELDLIILNTAPLSLTGRILQTKKVLVDKDPFKRYEYESLTLRKFFDFRIKEDAFFQMRYGRD